jgi:hypothetical protein
VRLLLDDADTRGLDPTVFALQHRERVFRAASGIDFADLDMLAFGPVVRDVSKEFDLISIGTACPQIRPPPASARAVRMAR